MRRALLLLSLLTLVACGTQAPSADQPVANPPAGPGSATGGTGGAPNGLPPCPDPGVIGPALGMTLEGSPTTNASDLVRVCMYTGRMVANNKASTATVALHTHYGAEDLARYRQQEVDGGNAIRDYAGAGERAFTWTVESLGNTITNLVAHKGDLMVYIGSRASLDQEVALANRLLSQ